MAEPLTGLGLAAEGATVEAVVAAAVVAAEAENAKSWPTLRSIASIVERVGLLRFSSSLQLTSFT